MPGAVYSVQSQVLDAVAALLNGIAGASSYRSRMIPFNAEQVPAFNIFPGETEAVYEGAYGGSVNWKFRFEVRCTVVGIDGVDKLADPLFVGGSAAILADPTLGGLVTITRFAGVKPMLEGEGLQAPFSLAVTFECEFATSRSNPSVSVP